jgi:quinol monooxygenase YgiN
MQELALIVEAETVGDILPKEHPTRLVFFEIWASTKAYDDHRTAPHSLRLRAALQGKCKLVQSNWCTREATATGNAAPT